MTQAEINFLKWLSDRPYMIVKKHRPEVRANIMKALKGGKSS